MPSPLRLQPESCSPLGKLVLQHIKEHNISMSELARISGISQPGLRTVCLKGKSPTDATLQKLAPVLGKTPLELFHLSHSKRIEGLQCEDRPLTSGADILTKEFSETVQEIGPIDLENLPPKTTLREAFKKALVEIGVASF